MHDLVPAALHTQKLWNIRKRKSAKSEARIIILEQEKILI